MFNDRRFKENPNDMVYANNAISCYLQAAGLYKNGKTRKLLARILWLISLDDASGTLAQAFENFRGEVPVWYWITFIPQLLTSLSQKEAKLAKQILIRIAKIIHKHYISNFELQERNLLLSNDMLLILLVSKLLKFLLLLLLFLLLHLHLME